MENKIENLKNAVNSYQRITEEGKERKSIGASIAVMVCNAYKENDLETIAFIEKQKEEKNEAFKTAKSYVSKGTKVGKAFQSGVFDETNNQEVTTLYDILLKQEKEDKAKQAALSEKRANEHEALCLALDTKDQKTIDDFILSSDPMTYASTLQTGLVLLGEAQTLALNSQTRKDAEENTTTVKAFITSMFESQPDLFLEIMDHVLSHSDQLKTKAA